MLKWVFLRKSVKVIPNNLLQTDVKKWGSTPVQRAKIGRMVTSRKNFFHFFTEFLFFALLM